MSSISGAGASSSAASMQTRMVDPAKLQQKLLAKLDTNGDKSIDKNELKSFVDFVSTQTGGTSTADTSAASSTDALFSTLDSDSDGSISSTELADNGKALFDQLRDQLRNSQLSSSEAPPPPPPMHGDESDMFAKIDANSDGSIEESELTSFISEGIGGSGQGPSVDDILARDDTDGDGAISFAEFQSAMSQRPERSEQSASEAQDGMQLGRLIASLLEQYSAVSSTTASSPAAQSLSIAV